MTSTTEIKLYMERARDTLQESRDILSLNHFNVVVSRAYYAMFYAATAILLSKGISRRKHSGVQSAFGQYLVKVGLIEPEYSRMLANAFRLRLDSDYEIRLNTDKTIAEDTLNDAEKFLNRIEAHLQKEGFL